MTFSFKYRVSNWEGRSQYKGNDLRAALRAAKVAGSDAQIEEWNDNLRDWDLYRGARLAHRLISA